MPETAVAAAHRKVEEATAEFRDIDGGGMWSGVWPSVGRREWCGEHPQFEAYLASLKES